MSGDIRRLARRYAALLHKMNRIYLSITLTLALVISIKAQGGWNIGYIQADSITKKYIGWKVLPDFIANSEWKEKVKSRLETENPNPRYFIRGQDSSFVTIKDQEYLIREIRRIGVDYGYMKDQSVELKNKKGRTFEVYEMTLTDYKEGAVELEIKHRKLEARFWIEINKLDGLIFEK